MDSAIRLLLADVDGTLVTQNKVLTDQAIPPSIASRRRGALRGHERRPAAGHVDARGAPRLAPPP